MSNCKKCGFLCCNNFVNEHSICTKYSSTCTKVCDTQLMMKKSCVHVVVVGRTMFISECLCKHRSSLYYYYTSFLATIILQLIDLLTGTTTSFQNNTTTLPRTNDSPSATITTITTTQQRIFQLANDLNWNSSDNADLLNNKVLLVASTLSVCLFVSTKNESVTSFSSECSIGSCQVRRNVLASGAC